MLICLSNFNTYLFKYIISFFLYLILKCMMEIIVIIPNLDGHYF